MLAQALALQGRGQFAEAGLLYRRIIAIQPNHNDALLNLADISLQSNDAPAALAFLERLTKGKPRHARAQTLMGVALNRLKRPQEALVRFDKALAVKPTNPEALYHRGFALGMLGRYEESLTQCERALAIKPDDALALKGRADALAELGRHDEALASYQDALALHPGIGRIYNAMGKTLTALGRYAEACTSFSKALELEPGMADAHFNLGLNRLTCGDFNRGWQEYEWRWRSVQVDGARDFVQHRWMGQENIAGKTILVHAEQGLGDTLQFCRYAPLLAQQGARVILEVQPPLVALLQQLPGVEVVSRGQHLPYFHLHCPLLSLPAVFRTDTTTIPAPAGYLEAPRAAVARWRDKLGPPERPRIGLAWSGSISHRNDRQRSIPLQVMQDCCIDGLDFVSLQKDLRPADDEVLRQHPRIRTDDPQGFEDVAALMHCMDVIVTVDTVVAHLAGALGKTVWILLPFAPDWRWLLEREDSPWYDTARLFRQPAIRDWTPVIARIRAELATMGSNGRTTPG